MMFGEAMKFAQRDGIRIRRTGWPESWECIWYDGTRVRIKFTTPTKRALDTWYPTQRDMTMDDWEFVRDPDRVKPLQRAAA